MKKKYYIGCFLVFVCMVVSMAIIWLLPINDKVKIALFFVVVIAMLFPVSKLEKQMKEFNKEEDKKKEELQKKEFINILFEKKNIDPIFEVMYDLITEENIEINQLIKELDMIVTFDYIIEDNYFEVSIENKVFKKNDFNCITICLEGNEKIYDSSFEDEESDFNIYNANYNDIISKIILNLKGTSEN